MVLLISFKKMPIIPQVSSIQLSNQIGHNLKQILYLKCSNSNKWPSEKRLACCLPTTFISKTEFPFVNMICMPTYTEQTLPTREQTGHRLDGSEKFHYTLWCNVQQGKNTTLLSDLLRKNRLWHLFQYWSVIFQVINWIILVKNQNHLLYRWSRDIIMSIYSYIIQSTG